MKKENYCSYFSDCYVLTNLRNSLVINSFLEKFTPNNVEMADEYLVPYHSNEAKYSFDSAIHLIDYLIQNPNEKHAIYWTNQDESDLTSAMCFFTDDGFLILGLSTRTKYPNTEIEDVYLTQLKSFAGSEIGLILYENPPPLNSDEFKMMIEKEV